MGQPVVAALQVAAGGGACAPAVASDITTGYIITSTAGIIVAIVLLLLLSCYYLIRPRGRRLQRSRSAGRCRAVARWGRSEAYKRGRIKKQTCDMFGFGGIERPF